MMLQTEYEQTLQQAGFRRCELPGHIQTTLANGEVCHICEAAAQDDCDTYEARLAYLIDVRDWENEQIRKPPC